MTVSNHWWEFCSYDRCNENRHIDPFSAMRTFVSTLECKCKPILFDCDTFMYSFCCKENMCKYHVTILWIRTNVMAILISCWMWIQSQIITFQPQKKNSWYTLFSFGSIYYNRLQFTRQTLSICKFSMRSLDVRSWALLHCKLYWNKWWIKLETQSLLTHSLLHFAFSFLLSSYIQTSKQCMYVHINIAPTLWIWSNPIVMDPQSRRLSSTFYPIVIVWCYRICDVEEYARVV